MSTEFGAVFAVSNYNCHSCKGSVRWHW